MCVESTLVFQLLEKVVHIHLKAVWLKKNINPHIPHIPYISALQQRAIAAFDRQDFPSAVKLLGRAHHKRL